MYRPLIAVSSQAGCTGIIAICMYWVICCKLAKFSKMNLSEHAKSRGLQKLSKTLPVMGKEKGEGCFCVPQLLQELPGHAEGTRCGL